MSICTWKKLVLQILVHLFSIAAACHKRSVSYEYTSRHTHEHEVQKPAVSLRAGGDFMGCLCERLEGLALGWGDFACNQGLLLTVCIWKGNVPPFTFM